METLHGERSSGEAQTSPDPSWRGLYQAGGISAALFVVLVIVPLALIFTTPQPPISGGAATLHYIALHKPVYLIELVSFVGLSLFAIFVGVGVYVPHLVVARATGSDYTGALFLVAGVVLLGLAFWLGLHGHRRLLQALAIPLLLFVVLQWIVEPAREAGVATNTPRPVDPPASTLGIPGARNVTFPASDGVRLASAGTSPARTGQRSCSCMART